MDLPLTQDTYDPIADENLEHSLALVERLYQEKGGFLDDSAVLAVSELTGVPQDYVRLFIKIRTEKQHKSLLAKLRAQFLTLEPGPRLYASCAVMGAVCSFLNVADWRAERYTRTLVGSSYGVLAMLVWILATLTIVTAVRARDPKHTFFGAALFGGTFYFGLSPFSILMGIHMDAVPAMLVPVTIGSGILGVLGHIGFGRLRQQFGIKDSAHERQELLRQLVDLQSKLREGEQTVTFVSLDVVGSTRMKEGADQLAIEFTFTEYHNFVESIVKKHNGRIHSTAGDGVTCAFEAAPDAWMASKHILGGLFELNAFRNKIGTPIELRIGIHTGDVVAPTAGDIRSVNFAHVIDIAAHMQKAAPCGGVVISDESSRHIPGGPGAIGVERIDVSGIPATIWVPKQISVPQMVALPTDA